MRTSRLCRRPGAALMFVVVVLAVYAALLTSITTQVVTTHRLLDRRELQRQSLWLARSGLEHGIAHLLQDPKYTGQTLKPIPQGEVRITIAPDQKSADYFQITSEATYPKDLRNPVVHSFTRRYRRVTDGSSTRLEPVTERNP